VKLEIAKNSLFAIQLHSPWWISVAIAGGIGVVVPVVLPEAYVVYGAFVATPLLDRGHLSRQPGSRMRSPEGKRHDLSRVVMVINSAQSAGRIC
jgi:hypothetical protein